MKCYIELELDSEVLYNMLHRARKMFFTRELTDKIKNNILTEDRDGLPDIKLCMVGDLEGLLLSQESNLKDTLDMFLPAVLIIPDGIEIQETPGNKSIVNQWYNFRIQYVTHKNFDVIDYEEDVLKCIEDAEVISSMLINDDSLQGCTPGSEPYLQLYDKSKINPEHIYGTLEAHLLDTEVTEVEYNKVASAILTDIINAQGTSSPGKKVPNSQLYVCEMDYGILLRTTYIKGGYNNGK